MALTPSLEDYLEAVLVISQKKKVIRIKDIVKHLGVKAASVVGAMKTLTDRSLVVHERYGYVDLTDKGVRIAKDIYKRHKVLTKFFHEILGVDLRIATKDACRIEHYIDKKTLERIVKFIEFIETSPDEEPLWLSHFYHFLKTGTRPESCSKGGESGGKMKQMTTLNKLKVGQKGRVVRILASEIKRRLLDMGIVPGVEIKIEKTAPLGDPVDILVKGYHLSLRKEETSAITIEVIE